MPADRSTRKGFLAMLFATLPLLGQKASMAKQKERGQRFYITGLFHSDRWNDCTVPPIITYGSDRVDALLHCCEVGGLTVWTEQEYKEMRKRIGADFDKDCQSQLGNRDVGKERNAR